jgi:hypothetical protein
MFALPNAFSARNDIAIPGNNIGPVIATTVFGAGACRQSDAIEHFRARWLHLAVKKMRKNNSMERGFDSIKTKGALAIAPAATVVILWSGQE